MINWKNILIHPDTAIFKAIEIIDREASQIALIVDDQERLLGVVTDGDIRRSILKKLDLSTSVKRIMNITPTVSSVIEDDQQVLAKMQSLHLRHIPIIDASKKIVGVKTLESLIKQSQDNTIVLMAGGLGNRLGSLTESCPKPLLKLGKKPILHSIIDNFIDAGFKNFYISLNYKAAMIEDYFGDGDRFGINIKYLKENKKLGTAGSLSLLPKNLTKPLIVMNADLLTKLNFKNLLDFHALYNADATMCVTEYDFKIPYGVVDINDHKIIAINEKPTHDFFVNAGIYVLNPTVLDLIFEHTYLDMTQLFEQLLARNLNVVSFPIREYWLDIGNVVDFERACLKVVEG